MLNKLTIIIPCYNEEKYVEKVLSRVCNVSLKNNLAKEIIIVDDGSDDNTFLFIQSFCSANKDYHIVAIQHPKNKGKGACIKSALGKATGQILIIQDADLEYNPNDYNLLLEPILSGRADVVLGSRFKGNGVHKGPFILHAVVNKVYTFISNIFTHQNLSDIHTCYKMFKTDILKKIDIRENRFGVDPEIIAKLGRKKEIKIIEVGISYYGRNFAEGKKISWYDGFRALYCILKYNIFK